MSKRLFNKFNNPSACPKGHVISSIIGAVNCGFDIFSNNLFNCANDCSCVYVNYP